MRLALDRSFDDHVIGRLVRVERRPVRLLRAAAQECDPSNDLRGTEEYKRDLVRVLTKRAVRKAAE